MEIKVGSQRFEDKYRKERSCSMKDRVEEKGRVVYVRRELAIIRSCASVARKYGS